MSDKAAAEWHDLRADMAAEGLRLERFSEDPETVSLIFGQIQPGARTRVLGILVDARSDELIPQDFTYLVADSMSVEQVVHLLNEAGNILAAEQDMSMPDPEWVEIGPIRVILSVRPE